MKLFTKIMLVAIIAILLTKMKSQISLGGQCSSISFPEDETHSGFGIMGSYIFKEKYLLMLV